MQSATSLVQQKSSARRRSSLSPEQLHAYLSDLFGDDLHAKRVLSLRNGVLGVLQSAALGVYAIGLGLAAALSLTPKHAIKQVDRLLRMRGSLRVGWPGGCDECRWPSRAPGSYTSGPPAGRSAPQRPAC